MSEEQKIGSMEDFCKKYYPDSWEQQMADHYQRLADKRKQKAADNVRNRRRR